MNGRPFQPASGSCPRSGELHSPSGKGELSFAPTPEPVPCPRSGESHSPLGKGELSFAPTPEPVACPRSGELHSPSGKGELSFAPTPESVPCPRSGESHSPLGKGELSFAPTPETVACPRSGELHSPSGRANCHSPLRRNPILSLAPPLTCGPSPSFARRIPRHATDQRARSRVLHPGRPSQRSCPPRRRHRRQSGPAPQSVCRNQ